MPNSVVEGVGTVDEESKAAKLSVRETTATQDEGVKGTNNGIARAKDFPQVVEQSRARGVVLDRILRGRKGAAKEAATSFLETTASAPSVPDQHPHS